MTVLVLPVAPVRKGQRVWANGGFRTVTTVKMQNYHSWCAILSDGCIYAPGQMALNVVELHPPRDTAPCEVLP